MVHFAHATLVVHNIEHLIARACRIRLNHHEVSTLVQSLHITFADACANTVQMAEAGFLIPSQNSLLVFQAADMKGCPLGVFDASLVFIVLEAATDDCKICGVAQTFDIVLLQLDPRTLKRIYK